MMKFEKEYVLARFKHEVKQLLSDEAHFAEECGTEAYGFTMKQIEFYCHICDVFEEFVNDADLAENVKQDASNDAPDLPF